HDGAVLIDSGRISRVNVILPLSHRNDVPPEFGTRHRAAMGLAERSDAAVVVVSEERGEVILMRGSTWQVVPNAAELVMLLQLLHGGVEVRSTERVWRAFT